MKYLVPTLLLSLFLSLPGHAVAETEQDGTLHPFLERRHTFMAGAYWQEADAEIRETQDPLPRVAVNLGHLGVDETDETWYLEYRYRFAERWSFVAAAQTFSSRGELSATRDLNFAGITFPAGASLRSELDVNTYFVDLMYHAYRSDRAEFAIGGGLHIFEFDAEITGRAFIENRLVSRERELVAANSDMLAPLPNIRAHGVYALNDRWLLAANVGWMSANVDEYSGSFTYLHLRTHLRLSERFGVALGYQFTDIDVERERRRRESEYDIEFEGPSLMITYGL